MATLRPTHTLTQMSKNLTRVIATPKEAWRSAGSNNNKPLVAERVKMSPPM